MITDTYFPTYFIFGFNPMPDKEKKKKNTHARIHIEYSIVI